MPAPPSPSPTRAIPPSAPPPAGPSPHIDLLPGSIIERAAGRIIAPPPVDSAGKPGNPGRGSQPSLTPQQIVEQTVSDAVGESHAQSGNVPPALRDIERGLGDRFRPPRDAISSDSAAQLAAAQAKRLAREGPRSTPLRGAQMDKSTYYGGGNLRQLEALELGMDQQIAMTRAMDQPGSWRSAVVRVVLGPGGELITVELASPSGRAALDAIAVDAVRRELHGRGAELAEVGPGEARYALEGAVAVHLPNSMMGGSLSLDSLPFRESLHYRVRLLGFSPRK